jgi:hypothetical protein
MTGGLFAKTVWALSKGLTSAVRRPTSVCGAGRQSSGEPPENHDQHRCRWSARRRDWHWPSVHSALGGVCADRQTCKSRKLFGMSHFHKLTEILQAMHETAGSKAAPTLEPPAFWEAVSAGALGAGKGEAHCIGRVDLQRDAQRPPRGPSTAYAWGHDRCGQGPCASGRPRTWSRAGPTALARNGRSGIIALRTSGHPTSVAFGERRRLGSPAGELLIGAAPAIRCVIGGDAPLINNRLEPTES